MRKIIGISVVVFILGIGVGLFIFYSTPKPKPKVIIKTRTITKTITEVKSKIDPVKLTNWIYKNSFKCSKVQAKHYAQLILSQPHALLVAAIIKNESSFNVTAYNSVGKTPVIGLMQIYCTKDHINQLTKTNIIKTPRDLFDPRTNIKAGVLILNDILRINNNNIYKSLVMYCGGSKRYTKNVLETLGQLVIEVKGN